MSIRVFDIAMKLQDYTSYIWAFHNWSQIIQILDSYTFAITCIPWETLNYIKTERRKKSLHASLHEVHEINAKLGALSTYKSSCFSS
jgi:hypothetical protein